MYEFRGYLTGAAEKHLIKYNIKFSATIIFFTIILWYPAVAVFSIMEELWVLLDISSVVAGFMPLLCLSPLNKKIRKRMTPKQIYTEDGYIVCVTDNGTESKRIKDIKVVRDYGEFYHIEFRFGNLSPSFICQKSLLTRGTLSGFESVLKKRIRRVKPKGNISDSPQIPNDPSCSSGFGKDLIQSMKKNSLLLLFLLGMIFVAGYLVSQNIYIGFIGFGLELVASILALVRVLKKGN